MSGVSDRAALLVRNGAAERRLEFRGQALVGREEGCDVVLPGRSVSRRHARIELTMSGWVLRDLGSGNGSFVRGERVTEAPVEDGDEIRFGEVRTVFENLPEPPVSKLEETARNLSQSLSIKPVKKARPVAAFVVTTVGFLLVVALTVAEKGCLQRLLSIGR